VRILNVGSSPSVEGGSDRYTHALAALLERRGHQVLTLTPRRGPLASDDEIAGPPPVETENPGPGDAVRFVYSVPASESVERALSEFRPDVVHLQVYYGQMTASILAPLRRASVPVVQTLHDYKLACPVRTFISRDHVCEACLGRRFWHALPRLCNRGSLARTSLSVLEAYVSRWLGDAETVDRFIAVSEFVRRKMIEHGVTGPERITTVHNFVETGPEPPARGPGEHVLFVGRLSPIKGVSTLLEAAATLAPTPFVIAGDGPSRPSLEREARERGITNVRFVGFVRGTELDELVAGSVCTVLPSIGYETFGLAIVESFAAGRPAVASRVGGMTEVVTDGVDGFLVPPGDPEALHARLAWLLERPDEAVAMGVAGRRKVEHAFGPERHYERVMDVYRSVL